MQNLLKIRHLDFEKKNESSVPKNALENTNERTCNYVRYVTLLICLL